METPPIPTTPLSESETIRAMRIWMAAKMNSAATKRFMAAVKIVDADGCWLWKGATTQFGHGRFRLGSTLDGSRTIVRAHRFSYELFIGPITGGLLVCHRCDNPPCVNPAHLFLGTNQDNLRDMAAKGRTRWGRRTHCQYGHALVEANLVSRGGGLFRCRECSINSNKSSRLHLHGYRDADRERDAQRDYPDDRPWED
jgi:hypothetical protein